MKQVLIRQGKVEVSEVPAPQVAAGCVLVRVERSCLSTGTELGTLAGSATPLWKRALARPEAVKRVAEMALREGAGRAREAVRGALETAVPTGYSAAGTVLEAGAGIDDLKPGDRVACAGAQCAHHAELISVPRNLAVPVPEGVDLDDASTVALGAIALQGVRRASPTLGECFAVIGLGLLGQLTVQLLRASGCRVVGSDLDPERVALAASLGMDAGVLSDQGPEVERVMRLTGGAGADGVLITAATPSDAVVSTAFRMCRKKGRVVLVGAVGLGLDRDDFYRKELDFLISTSYGPGRYDEGYEAKGLDYPIGYVRWTENRNMAEYLRLVAEGKVALKPLLGGTWPVERAAEAYGSLSPGPGEKRPLLALLSYPQPAARDGAPRRVVPNPRARPAPGPLRIAVVGAGQFARAVHLPNLRSLGHRYRLQAVVSRTGHNAAEAARQFGAAYATTDLASVLADREVDAVLVATRHASHASLALQALEAGKHVLVEKPLALLACDLDRIEAFYAARPEDAPGPVLLTGFNRRFSPFARRAHELVRDRTNPLVLAYRMNAGHVPLDSWIHGAEGGGRNLGEACHVYDLFAYLTGGRATSVSARSLRPRTAHYGSRDNFAATLGFDDGSVATLVYTALGSRAYPKEHLEVYCDGRVLVLEDYRALRVHGSPAKGLATRVADKGHRAELEAFARAVLEGGEWPIPLTGQLEASRIALAVEAQL